MFKNVPFENDSYFFAFKDLYTSFNKIILLNLNEELDASYNSTNFKYIKYG